jgi:hypothetical protein
VENHENDLLLGIGTGLGEPHLVGIAAVASGNWSTLPSVTVPSVRSMYVSLDARIHENPLLVCIALGAC